MALHPVQRKDVPVMYFISMSMKMQAFSQTFLKNFQLFLLFETPFFFCVSIPHSSQPKHKINV